MRPMESSVVCISQEGAGYTLNSVGGAYRDGVARTFEDMIRVAEIYLEMREINPNVSIRALSRAARVGKTFVTKVISEVESGALIDPRLQVKYHAQGAGSLTISYEDGMFLLALRAKNNQTTLKAYCRCLYWATGKLVSQNSMPVVSDSDAIQGGSVDCQSGAYQQVQAREHPTATRVHGSVTRGDYLWYEHGILITFLPTRAPELNPIEQM